MKTDPTTTKPGAASEPPARGGVPSKIDKVQTDEDLTRVASDDVRTLKIADISVAPDLRLRDQTNAGIASGYAKLLQAGTIFPPILVYKINGKHVLVDGHHRVDAHRQAGFDKISATIVIGDMATAFAAAVKANAAHGLRFTNADKKRAVCLALTQFPTHSDRLIAEICCVSDRFVNRVRPASGANGSQVRIGRDNKKYKKRSNPTKAGRDPGEIIQHLEHLLVNELTALCSTNPQLARAEASHLRVLAKQVEDRLTQNTITNKQINNQPNEKAETSLPTTN